MFFGLTMSHHPQPPMLALVVQTSLSGCSFGMQIPKNMSEVFIILL